jgi:hypothetical protein
MRGNAGAQVRRDRFTVDDARAHSAAFLRVLRRFPARCLVNRCAADKAEF